MISVDLPDQRALRDGAAAIVLMMALAGCADRDPIIEGGDTPPASFGEVMAIWSGCAPVSGLYAWPPVEGRADDGREPRIPGPPLPILMPTDLALFAEAQIWIDERQGFRLNSRMVNRDPKLGIRALTTQWSYHELFEVSCEDGRWSWTAPPADGNSRRAGIERARLVDTAAETLTGGIEFQAMADGALAIGQWEHLRFRADGRVGPPKAGESRLDPPDRIVWRWSLLRRLGNTGEGVPPDDAGLTQNE